MSSTMTAELYAHLHDRGAEVWAKDCNRHMRLGLNAAQEEDLAMWLANAMQAATDRALQNSTEQIGP
jgi:hypothetical protein